jgi:pentatricopeptide repeat protein
MYDEMRMMKLQPNVITFNCLMAACVRGEAWNQAIDVFETMLQVLLPSMSPHYCRNVH